ncbi:hypothetical protein CUMW_269690 [Citrus unshiu]|uniref:Uncharacterized protein n=1 Tax=Citrus unshiu TaxID=55188 RepID=A0A2H5QWZ5_CITUN|nr:hypothetical protein CUMW_269690 [Citrus unshiu]
MAKMIMLYGFGSLASPKAVEEFLEGHTGEGTVSNVEVGQNKCSIAHAIVEFKTVEAAELIKCLARERLCYGNSYLKASNAKRRTPHYKLGEDLKLNFGCQISTDKFSVFWSQENVSVKLCSDLRKFGFFLSYESVDYKLELSYESIWQIELHRPSGHSVKYLVIQKDIHSLREVDFVEDEAEHESAHLGVLAGMFLNTSPAPHLGIVMKSARDNLEHPSWQNCCAELPLPIGQSSAICLELPSRALIPKALKDFFHYKESLVQFTLVPGSVFSCNSDLVPMISPTHGIQLPFKILFKVNSLLQHGCISGLALDAKFFRLVDPSRIRMENMLWRCRFI